ncbi:gp53-like domain-containing protein [Rouxiella sp. Mn2063]|uniref:gp53-like domain-containing protein n=1 Tax=Rouxiella sp. Mn2063 TaxID=3395262 RepID=UPI003BC8335B
MAVNNFKPFGVGKAANVSTQADYEALPALDSGFSAGKASSAQINKALRQGTVMSSVLAQFIANLSGKDVLDDGNTQAVLNNLIAALKANGSKDFLQAANSLAEIKAAGPDAVANALANLSLGEAAKRGVGTGVGQLPDMGMFSLSAGNNGFQKLPSGLIVQWATGGSDANGVMTLTLPMSFPTAVVGGIANEAYPSGWGPNNTTVWSFDLSRSNQSVGVALVRNVDGSRGPIAASGVSGRILVWGY